MRSVANIVYNPHILGGKPIIAGTRISVELVMDLLATGMNIAGIQKEYPRLTQDQIKSAIVFASSRIKRETVMPIEKRGDDIVLQAA